MRTSNDSNKALKAELEAAVLATSEHLGTAGLVKASVVKPFLGRGVHQATLYRWFDEIMASGRPGQHAMRQVRAAAAKRAEKFDTPAAAVAQVVEEARALMPVTPRMEDVIGGGRTVNAIDRLQGLIHDLDGLIRYAKTDDGKIRNARLLGDSIEKMRRCLETAMKFHAVLRETAEVSSSNSTSRVRR